jgi:hypothetical protein
LIQILQEHLRPDAFTDKNFGITQPERLVKFHSTHGIPFCRMEFPFWDVIFPKINKNRDPRMEMVLHMHEEPDRAT